MGKMKELAMDIQMMQTAREDMVAAFNTYMGHPVNGRMTVDELMLRLDLIDEEVEEFAKEVRAAAYMVLHGKRPDNLPEMLKELADIQYVISGFAVAFGLPLGKAFERVHKSNLSKLGDDGKPIYREDGKVMKGPNYQPPKLQDLV